MGKDIKVLTKQEHTKKEVAQWQKQKRTCKVRL